MSGKGGVAKDGMKKQRNSKSGIKGPFGNTLTKKEAAILTENAWLTRIPMLSPTMCDQDANPSLAAVTSRIALVWRNDFSWAAYFEPEFMAVLMYEGFLPTAHDVDGPYKYVLLPKLHESRCVMDLNDLAVSKSARRRSNKFSMSINQRFNEVVAKCVQQHGESWLHPPIVEGFKKLFELGGVGTVKMWSVECYEGTTLVAGELGYSVGGSYCSLTGFSSTDSAGTVQLTALGILLNQRGFSFWDLGMAMEYKHALGAKDTQRTVFLGKLHSIRGMPSLDLSLPVTSASELVCPKVRPGERVHIPALAQSTAVGGAAVHTLSSVGLVEGFKAGKLVVKGDEGGAKSCVWEKDVVRFCDEGYSPPSDGVPLSLRGGGGRGTSKKKERKRPSKMSEEEWVAKLQIQIEHHKRWEACRARRSRVREYLRKLLSGKDLAGSLSKRGKRRMKKLKIATLSTSMDEQDSEHAGLPQISTDATAGEA